MKVSRQSRRSLRAHNILATILILVIVGLLAWLSTRYDYQADLTANGRNTLSAESAAVLDKFTGPVAVTAFAHETDMLRQHINDLFSRYQRHKPDMHLRFVNPDLEPQRTRELGITADGELLLEYDGQAEQLQELTERGFSNALQRLLRGGGRRIVFIQGHGERNPGGDASYDLSQWAAQLEAKGFDISTINLAHESVVNVDDATVYVLASPRSDFLPAEVEKIKALAVGRLLWLADPGPMYGLEALAAYLSLAFNPGMIVDPNISQVGMMLFGTDDPRITLVSNYTGHPIVNDFSFNTLFPMSQGLMLLPDGEWQGTAFLNTMSNAWQETQQMSGEITLDADDIAGPLSVGVALQRAPSVAGQAYDARVVVIGDGDFISNAAIGVGGNLQLSMNIVNWLSGNDQLVDVPVKVSGDTELQLDTTVVLIIGAGFLVVLPALLLFSGFYIWWRRRKY